MLSGIMLAEHKRICVQFLHMKEKNNSNFFQGFIPFSLYFSLSYILFQEKNVLFYPILKIELF